MRLQPAQLAALDVWMGRQDARLSRPEAITVLLEQALAITQPASREPKSAVEAIGLSFQPDGQASRSICY